MMLAKFSGMPISTQISSVTRPASSSGTSVSSTSPKRRSTIHSRIAIDDQRVDAGLDEGRDHGVAGLQDRDRAADRVRVDGQHGAREIAQHLGVVGIAFRRRPRRGRGRPARPIARLSCRRQVVDGDRLRLRDSRADRRASIRSGTTKAACAVARCAWSPRASLVSVGGKALGRVGAGARRIAGDLGQLVGDAVAARRRSRASVGGRRGLPAAGSGRAAGKRWISASFFS